MTSTRTPLFLASIGNPSPRYAHTFHSAGHTLLAALHARLSAPSLRFRPFAAEKKYPHGTTSFNSSIAGFGLLGADWKQGGAAAPLTGAEGGSAMRDWTLWQSGSHMNASGRGVAAAWRAWREAVAKSEGRAVASRALLVVLHDEMERPIGKVVMKRGRESLKGHNGLKSVSECLGGAPFVRVGVGIGRPVSRASEDVSNYVLGKMTKDQEEKIVAAAPEVMRLLVELCGGE